jgi:hypothetical protein
MGAAVLRCEQLAIDIENRDGGVATFDLQGFSFRHIAQTANSGECHIGLSSLQSDSNNPARGGHTAQHPCRGA